MAARSFRSLSFIHINAHQCALIIHLENCFHVLRIQSSAQFVMYFFVLFHINAMYRTLKNDKRFYHNKLMQKHYSKIIHIFTKTLAETCFYFSLYTKLICSLRIIRNCFEGLSLYTFKILRVLNLKPWL